jgi:hypothetical protein
MHGRSVSTVTAYTAHREWARRPPDERYASVHALAEAARARRHRTDARITETVDLQVQAATADALAISDRSADPLELRAARRHRRRAARSTSERCPRRSRRRDQLRAATAATRRSISSSRIGTNRGPSTRSPHRGTRGSTTTSWPTACSTSWPSTRPGTAARLQGRRIWCRTGPVRRLSGRSRHVPVPRGRQPRSRRPHRRSQAGMFRGFILRNSDVGAAALTLDVFLFRAVCGESHHLGLSPRRRLPAPARGRVDSRRVDGLARDVRARSTQTSPTIAPAPASHLPGARPDARGGPRCGHDSGSICRGSTPPRPTRWRSSMRRTRVPSGATCRG